MEKQLRYIIGSLNVGGAERHLVQILPALVKKGWAIEVLTLTEKGALAPVLEKAGVRIRTTYKPVWLHKLPRLLQRIVKLLLALHFLYLNFKNDRKTITHFFLPESYILGMTAAFFSYLTAPKIMSRRSLNYYQKKYFGIAQVEKFLHKKCCKILGNSKAIINQLYDEENIPKNKLNLIYNGIDLTAFKNMKNIRKELGISSESIVITIVANLIPYKGHKDLINALCSVKERLPHDWRLLCVGKDNGIGIKLKILAETSGISENILWLGARSDIPDILCSSDIGILCSHEEGFSNSILEYMATELPVIATDVGGNAEAVINSETGIIVPPKAPEKLGNAITMLALDVEKSKMFGKAGKNRVMNEFSLEKCVNEYEYLYENLI